MYACVCMFACLHACTGPEVVVSQLLPVAAATMKKSKTATAATPPATISKGVLLILNVNWVGVHSFAACALKGLALPRASHSGEIALSGSHRLRSTLVAVPVL